MLNKIANMYKKSQFFNIRKKMIMTLRNFLSIETYE